MKVVNSETRTERGNWPQRTRSQASLFRQPHALVEGATFNAATPEAYRNFRVFADQQAHCIHLNERDCSIQRRHQKVMKEAPARRRLAQLAPIAMGRRCRQKPAQASRLLWGAGNRGIFC